MTKIPQIANPTLKEKDKVRRTKRGIWLHELEKMKADDSLNLSLVLLQQKVCLDAFVR